MVRPSSYLKHIEIRDSKYDDHAFSGIYRGGSRDDESDHRVLVSYGTGVTTRHITVDIGGVRIDERGVINRCDANHKSHQPYAIESTPPAPAPDFSRWLHPGKHSLAILDIWTASTPDPTRPTIVVLGAGVSHEHDPVHQVGGRLWNTIAAGPSTHPYLLSLHPPRPAPTQLIAAMLGHCPDDRLLLYLCDSAGGAPRCDPVIAHDLLCRGLAVQPVAAILAAVRMLPKMRRVSCLLVAHDFCGAHTLGSVLRSMCWPHALVYASESDLAARSAVLHVHPELASCHFALTAGDIAVIHAAPWAHLYFCGFSCDSLSNLNEYDTTAELSELLLLLGRALEYVRHHRPLVVLFENVPSIFHSHHRDFLSAFYALLAPLDYDYD